MQQGFAHWPVGPSLRIDDKGNTMPGTWFLGVQVHNRGRLPVDVTGYQLRFDAGPAYGEMGGVGGPASAAFNPPRPHTLGPGQQAMWTLDMTGVQDIVQRAKDSLQVPARRSMLLPNESGIYARMVVDLGSGRTARSKRFSLDVLA